MKTKIELFILGVILLIPFVSGFSQGRNVSETIAVPEYDRIKPLLKENTFVVAYINVDKIGLDGFVEKSSKQISQFTRVSFAKLSELQKSSADQTPATNPPALTDPSTTLIDSNATPVVPNTTPVAPDATPNSTVAPTPALNAEPDKEPKTETANVDGMFEAATVKMLGDISESVRTTVGKTIADLQASGIKEFYVLSTMEIGQQAPALIAIPGKINLNAEFKATLESIGIREATGLTAGFTILVVNNPTANVAEPNATEINPSADFALDPATAQTTLAIEPANSDVALDAVDNTDTSAVASPPADSHNKVVDIFKKLKTVERNEIKSALHIQRNAAIRIVAAPSASIKTLASLASVVAPTDATGSFAEGIPKDAIKDGVQVLNKLQSVSIGFIPDQIRINLAIEFKNNLDAEAAYELIDKHLHKEPAPHTESQLKEFSKIFNEEQIARMKEVEKKIPNILKLNLRNHRILYSLTEKKITESNSLLAESYAYGIFVAEKVVRKIMIGQKISQIVIAMQNYHDAKGKFPPLYTVNAEGKPLHSWRVLLLPYLEQGDLHKQIKLDEPWDSEHNKQFHNAFVVVYQDANYKLPDQTKKCRFSVIVGSPMNVKVEPTFADIRDGTSNTVAVVELREPFCWMDPLADITLEEFSKPLDGENVTIGNPEGKEITIGMWDGSTKKLPLTTKPETLKAIATPNGGETINLE
ncbi:MAG: DUF1559 domain-containing protein [Planctomycetaceae bacterium]|jgi:hypothetical protein|nr:DUF1559 domain-containing protein [Planctomycetaceae bacterium]